MSYYNKLVLTLLIILVLNLVILGLFEVWATLRFIALQEETLAITNWLTFGIRP